MNDVFKIVAPGLTDSTRPGVIRVPPSCYDQCVTFALERLDGETDAR